MANAIAFVRNKFDEEIYRLEENVNKAETTFPFPSEIEIDYSNEYLWDNLYKKYTYVLQNTSKNYLKEIKYFDTKNEVVKKKNIYDVISRLNDGIIYKNNNINIVDLYTKIDFKLTPARKIEIRLTNSTNKRLLHYYYWLKNGIFLRLKRNKWMAPNLRWILQAQKIYKDVLTRTKSLWQANKLACKYIWQYYKNRPSSKIITNSIINFNSNNYVIIFNGNASDENSLYYNISFHLEPPDYSIFVSPESKWYKDRLGNVLRHFEFKGILDFSDEPNAPAPKLAQFLLSKRGRNQNEDFTRGWSIETELRINKKITGNNNLKTDLFYGKQKFIDAPGLDKYKIDNLKIADNDFTNLRKTIKPTEFAFFLYDNLNIIKETFVSELNKKVSLLGGVWYYVKANSKDGKIELVTPRNKLKFNIKQNISLPELSLSIAPVIASQKLNLRERKIKNLLIISTFSKNRKRKMRDILDTIMIKALQKFENYMVLNPLDIDIRSNYMTKILDDFKYSTYQVMLKNILFSANIVNDTQQIFITCYNNLDSAKKALINGKLYSILGIINLSEIKNWEEVKGKSIYVNAKFDDITSNTETAIHFGFKFNSAYPTEFFEFKI